MSEAHFLDLVILHSSKTGNSEVANKAATELSGVQIKLAGLQAYIAALEEELEERNQQIAELHREIGALQKRK